MTKILFILDAGSFLFSETDLEPAELERRLKSEQFELPFFAAVERVVPLDEIVVVTLRSLDPPLKRLTEQQRKVVEHLIRGLTVDQIALSMMLSRETVNFHIANAKNRLNLNTRNELIAQCSRSLPLAGKMAAPQMKTE